MGCVVVADCSMEQSLVIENWKYVVVSKLYELIVQTLEMMINFDNAPKIVWCLFCIYNPNCCL